MRNLVTTMVGASLLAIAVSANAQDAKPVGLSARIGIFSPTDKDTRKATEDGWLGFGVDYKLGGSATILGQAGSIGVSFDYTSKNGTRMVPLTLNYVVAKEKFYYFGGLGTSFVHPSGGKSDNLFAYTVGAGMDIGSQGGIPVFVEAKFLGTEKSEYNGFGFFAGVRF